MNTNRQILIFKYLAVLALVNIFCTLQSPAITNSKNVAFEDFRGLWETKIDDEAVYLLIKKNNVASYFYKDSFDNNVYDARWKVVEEKKLSISSEKFKDLRFLLKDAEPEIVSSHKGDKNTPFLTKISKEILGDWARPADYEAPKNKYMPSTYFGTWETKDINNPRRIIKISNNRTVISEIKKESTSSSQELLQGEWYKHGQQLHIAWEDGSYSIIDNRNEKRVKLFNFAPGIAIREEGSNYQLIEKGDNKTVYFKKQHIGDQSDNISLSQFTYKSLLKFYRGEWITLDENKPNAVEIMKLNRFGGLNLASDSKIKGSWYLSGKGCLINLEDGIRMKLKYIGSAFLLFVYKANRPLDGFPNKILKTSPLDIKKLDSLNQKPYFTLKLLKQVENLKPVGSKSIPLISNWSDRNIINPKPSSPWWWPIWSDKPKNKESDTFSANNLSPSLTNESDSIGSSIEATQKKLPEPMELINKLNWGWPY